MSVKIKTQTDSLTTKVSIELPADLQALDAIMRASKATGKIVAVYNAGGVQGVSIEQNTTIPEKISEDVRKLVGVGSKEIS